MTDKLTNELPDFCFLPNYHAGIAWLEKHGFQSVVWGYQRRIKTGVFGSEAYINLKYYETNSAIEKARGKWACNILFLSLKITGERKKLLKGRNQHTDEFHEVAFCDMPIDAIMASLTRASLVWIKVADILTNEQGV